MVCENFFEINGSGDILMFGGFIVQKVNLHNIIIIKIRTRKYHKNTAHRFGDNYFTNYFVKFLQYRIKSLKVGAVRVSTGYQFFLKIPLVRILKLPLTYSVNHVSNIKGHCVKVIFNLNHIF